ncbi:hypothetical protein PVAP13_8NG151400 [Panicum virgatum]|uniref:RRM domain-containing protein n=1 Tax=Panicum virgatum TaxID=38727 RepID=A0A8T0P3Y9_PANVG|nr:hypothetical protein PVAP13_8NG151400 [Panicum virgatum]
MCYEDIGDDNGRASDIDSLASYQLPWVKRDGKSLADHILFLGRPSSFAMDAVQPGMSGGSGFHDDTSEFVEQLPAKWNCEAAMWFTPQPVFATTEKGSPKPNQQFGADFRIYVGNLSRKMDSNQLRRFFSKHGKVVDARVVYEFDRKTGDSRGFGFVTMASTVGGEPAGAIVNNILDLRRSVTVPVEK